MLLITVFVTCRNCKSNFEIGGNGYEETGRCIIIDVYKRQIQRRGNGNNKVNIHKHGAGDASRRRQKSQSVKRVGHMEFYHQSVGADQQLSLIHI